MKAYDIEFKLNDEEKIIVKLDDPLSEVHICYRAPIFFVQHIKEYELMADVFPIWNNMQILATALRDALAGKLKLHESIKINENTNHDIGYMYNQDLRNKPGLLYEQWGDEEYELWVGYKYRLWGQELQLWLYNDENGDIIFKLTPLFPGGFALGDSTDPEEVERSIQYDAWIKNYKPFLIETLPRETAQRWLAHAEDIMKMIEDNERRMKAEYEAVSK